jgi:hypothetical protein
MKKTSPIYIYAFASTSFPDDFQFMASSIDRESSEYTIYTLIDTQEVEFEVDDNRDIKGELTANTIYALRKQKQTVLAESQVEANKIQDRIDSLLSLENKADQ